MVISRFIVTTDDRAGVVPGSICPRASIAIGKKEKDRARGQAPWIGDAMGDSRKEKRSRLAGAIKLSGKRTSKDRPFALTLSTAPCSAPLPAVRRARLNCRGKDRERAKRSGVKWIGAARRAVVPKRVKSEFPRQNISSSFTITPSNLASRLMTEGSRESRVASSRETETSRK